MKFEFNLKGTKIGGKGMGQAKMVRKWTTHWKPMARHHWHRRPNLGTFGSGLL